MIGRDILKEMTTTLLEDLVHELPEAQRRAARESATQDELEAWSLWFEEWAEKLGILTQLIKRHWFESAAELRTETVHEIGDWLNLGSHGMKLLSEHRELLPEEAWDAMRARVRAFIASTVSLDEAIHEITNREKQLKAIADASSEAQSKIEADYQKGKQEKAEGLTTVFTVEEFKQRFG
jgi:hypothetical protein